MNTATITKPTLRNGAEVLAHNHEIVLAIFNGRLVTWNYDAEGNCHWGHYFGEDVDAAHADFYKRIEGK
jgi:hypothetical protein